MEAQKRWYAETLPLVGEHIVDVGANVGELSDFFFSALQGQGSLLSVEPLRENVEQIEQRIARCSGSPRWQVRACAVSDEQKTVSLRVGSSEGTHWNSQVIPSPSPGQSVRTVPAQTLSSLCPHATVIKLDIEGHEYAVLADSLPKLPSVKAWAVELHMMPGSSLAQTARSFVQAGFRVFGAGRKRDDTRGAWLSAELPDGLEWDAIPVAQRRTDGSVFKMLHIIALRR